MGKDLRTIPIPLKIGKLPKLDGTFWEMGALQPFFPSLEELFKTESVASIHEYGLKLDETIESILDESHIRTTKRTMVPIHRKTTMLLSPFKTMRGDYGIPGLPRHTDTATDIQKRIQSPHAAGYVGALASALLSESGCEHFPKVFGVYVGVSTKYVLDISDDYEDLSEKHWFGNGIGKTFTLKFKEGIREEDFLFTRRQRTAIQLEELSTELLGIHDEDAESVDEVIEREVVASQRTESDSSAVSDDESDSSDVFEIESCRCEEEDESDEETDDEGDDEEPFVWATFVNTPVVTTVMEKCEGTFYDLLEKDSDPEHHMAWISQIVMALAYAQRNFGMTHNDLHGNNVMYIPTDKAHLFYRVAGSIYKIPTFGILIKLIDWDRAAFSTRLTGMKTPKVFMSSQFGKGEEAEGQYNVDPFVSSTHPAIQLSASFDLARFATSVFWDMFPKGPDADYTHPFFELSKSWMQCSDGSSVMFRAKRDNHDRYHGFDLYKAIARYCKNAVPRTEIFKMNAYRHPMGLTLRAPLIIEN